MTIDDVYRWVDIGGDLSQKKVVEALLKFATKSISHNVLKLMVDQGYQVDLKIEEQKNLFINASEVGNLLLVEYMFEFGFGADKQDISNANAFVSSISNPYLFDCFIEQGYDINTTNNIGQTPLLYAISNKLPPETITKLIVAGANLKVLDHGGDSPLITAIENNNTDAMKVLMKHGVNIKDPVYAKDAILFAAQVGAAWTIELLIKCGININSPENIQLNLLSNAILMGSSGGAKFIFKNTEDINTVDIHGNSPIFYACDKGLVSKKKDFLPLINQLIIKGANITGVGKSGLSAFKLIYQSKNLELITLTLLHAESQLSSQHLNEAIEHNTKTDILLLLKKASLNKVAEESLSQQPCKVNIEVPVRSRMRL